MISVIIPVHNGIETLDHAVQSVLQQTVCAEEQVEILLVDDGSAEETAQHCDKLAEEITERCGSSGVEVPGRCGSSGVETPGRCSELMEKNAGGGEESADETVKRDGAPAEEKLKSGRVQIRAFHMEDRGVSAARNLGLEEARGDYITFLDDDDAMAPAMLEELLRVQRETGADFCGCGFRSVKAEGMQSGRAADTDRSGEIANNTTPAENTTWDDIPSEKTGRGTLAADQNKSTASQPVRREKQPAALFRGADIITQRILQRDTRVWSKLFTREAIGSMRFLEGLTIGEDMLFVASLVRKNTVYAILDEALYFYTVNPEGAMERPFTRSYMDQIRCWDEAEKVIRAQFPEVLDNPGPAAQLGSLRIVSDVLTASKIAKLPEKEWQQYQPEFEKCRESLGRHRTIPGAKDRIPKDYRIKAVLLGRFPALYRKMYRPHG